MTVGWLEGEGESVLRARHLLEGSREVVVMTGAGLSTAAGIPDYRGPEGLWTRDPAAERSSRAEVYQEDPEVRLAAWRRFAARHASALQPTSAHRALVDLEKEGRLLGLVTQNVDGLHRAAGTSADRLVELHGSTDRVRCLRCGWRGDPAPVLARLAAGEEDPRCTEPAGGGVCAGLLSADIVRFGDSLDALDLARARAWFEGADTVVAAGSTLSVHPAAGLLRHRGRGVPLVIVNLESTALDEEADVVVRADVQLALATILSGGGPQSLDGRP